MKLNARFTALDDNLKLDTKERLRAIAVHNLISSLLVTAGIAKRTRLQGSFARKTMLPPLHDIDKVIELVDSLAATLARSDGPLVVMEMIKNAVLPTYPNAEFEIKKHALGIILPDDGFDFDAVPAFNPEDGSGWIRIANTKPSSIEDVWKPSNTYVLIDTVAERNGECGGRFVHQVRMVKQVFATAGLSDDVPGLHVETFAFAAISFTMEHPDAVAVALAKSVELLGGVYFDPTGVDQISNRLESHKVAAAKGVLAPLSTLANEALRLAAADEETKAAHIWADLFGDDVFPRPKDGEEKGFLAGLFAGGTVASTNRPAPPSRAWGL